MEIYVALFGQQMKGRQIVRDDREPLLAKVRNDFEGAGAAIQKDHFVRADELGCPPSDRSLFLVVDFAPGVERNLQVNRVRLDRSAAMVAGDAPLGGKNFEVPADGHFGHAQPRGELRHG